MNTNWIKRNAGLISMFGGALWFISNILEETFDLFPPNGEGPLYVTNQILAQIALIAVALGFLGIKWYKGTTSRVGHFSVWAFTVGYLLIIVGGISALILRRDDTPIFLVFPIGSLLMNLGSLVTGIAVVKEALWKGWTRYMPIVYAAYLWIGIEIPFMLGMYGEGGPGPVPMELIQDVGLFFVGLAIFQNRTKLRF